MSKKFAQDVFQTKTTRNDRFAQMSHQEKVIEEKKRELLARLEQKQKINTSTVTTESKTTSTTSTTKTNKSVFKSDTKNYNQFSNDGSFLDQFKQLKEKKNEQKYRYFRNPQEKNYSDDHLNKTSKWSSNYRSPSPKNKIKISRFSEMYSNNEPKITICTSYSNIITQNSYNLPPQVQNQIPINTQNIIGPPLLKNDIPPPMMDIPPPGITYPNTIQTPTSVIAASPIMLSVPPPQIIQQSASVTLVAPPPTLTTTAILTTVSNATPNLPPPNLINSLLHPPSGTISLQNPLGISNSQTLPTVNIINSCTPTLELASIPPPNPIQIQNIPQPEPINTLNIPPPAPLQVQNIPPPSPIQLNEIPNPKPMDVINIPTPTDASCIDKTMSDPEFIKSIPPPNKSIPPPNLQDTSINVNISVPPPNAIHTSNIPPPQNVVVSQNVTLQNILPSQNIMVHSVPPPQIIPTQCVQNIPSGQGITLVSQQSLQNLPTIIPPPPPPPQQVISGTSTIPVALSGQNSVNVSVLTVSTPNMIPSLLTQPVLPPPNINVASLPVNIHCPPPSVVLTATSTASLPTHIPPSFVNQPPPITTHLPPINLPPPTTTGVGQITAQSFKDLNSVCPPGTAEYEAMASLGRMVAQCGPGIEDIVRERKPQDSKLWFLFRKESAAYHQYCQLIEQFKLELTQANNQDKNYKPEDIYEPEMAIEEDLERIKVFQDTSVGFLSKKRENEEDTSAKRKRKSRWGEKDTSVPPPSSNFSLQSQVPIIPVISNSSSIALSKITRNDPGLIQYALTAYGTLNLSEDDWKKTEDNFKINIVYQDMLKKRDEAQRLAQTGKNKYEYDSDEDTEGGTWEHKLRNQEMSSTHTWASELTKNAEGKHHIGDFLPPDELKRFMERSVAAKEGREMDSSDYKDFKLKEDNVGFKMLQKLGWSEGQGLGANAAGVVEPINKAQIRDQNQGLGVTNPSNVDINDDEYDAYRKRMMLAYRFRPNPLNNPRRPYY